MDIATLNKYLDVFGHLGRNSAPGHGSAPHKPILLLAILDEIASGNIHDNLIELTPELIVLFTAYWKSLVLDPYWKMRIEYPFRHLHRDGFWHFVVYDHEVLPESHSYSFKQIKESFDGARLSLDLWGLLQGEVVRETFRRHLLQTYFHGASVQTPDATSLLDAEAERLKEEANAVFRIRKVKESDDAGYYVRHSRFPNVIKDLYGNICAVCEMSARTPEGASVIDAAHIMDFATFHLDDPRNGIALCKNHHWGFDTGMFSLTDAYTIQPSPRLQSNSEYIPTGKRIVLPANLKYAPSLDALAWHRQNRFRQ